MCWLCEWWCSSCACSLSVCFKSGHWFDRSNSCRWREAKERIERERRGGWAFDLKSVTFDCLLSQVTLLTYITPVLRPTERFCTLLPYFAVCVLVSLLTPLCVCECELFLPLWSTTFWSMEKDVQREKREERSITTRRNQTDPLFSQTNTKTHTTRKLLHSRIEFTAEHLLWFSLLLFFFSAFESFLLYFIGFEFINLISVVLFFPPNQTHILLPPPDPLFFPHHCCCKLNLLKQKTQNQLMMKIDPRWWPAPLVSSMFQPFVTRHDTHSISCFTGCFHMENSSFSHTKQQQQPVSSLSSSISSTFAFRFQSHPIKTRTSFKCVCVSQCVVFCLHNQFSASSFHWFLNRFHPGIQLFLMKRIRETKLRGNREHVW